MCYLFKVIRTCNVNSVYVLSICKCIHIESSAKRWFWDNPCQVNQQFLPSHMVSNHQEEKNTHVNTLYKVLNEFDRQN